LRKDWDFRCRILERVSKTLRDADVCGVRG
jgi:hypothetical protein